MRFFVKKTHLLIKYVIDLFYHDINEIFLNNLRQNGGNDMRKRKFVLIISILAIAIFFSLKIINEHRERNLADLIKYKPNDFQSLGYVSDTSEMTEGSGYEWLTQDKNPAEELIEFLSKYQVKKIDEEEYHEDVNDSATVEFIISHVKANSSMAWVSENNIHIFVGDYYKVVNGPVDMKWLKKYNEDNKALYAE